MSLFLTFSRLNLHHLFFDAICHLIFTILLKHDHPNATTTIYSHSLLRLSHNLKLINLPDWAYTAVATISLPCLKKLTKKVQLRVKLFVTFLPFRWKSYITEDVTEVSEDIKSRNTGFPLNFCPLCWNYELKKTTYRKLFGT